MAITQHNSVGNRLILPTFVDSIAQQDPDTPWMNLPRSPDLKQGWYTLSFKDLADAVNGVAGWAENVLGAGDGKTTIAYIGVNDARYAATLIGMMKAGYRTLLPSPRNSQEGQAALFEAVQCSIVVHSEGIASAVDSITAYQPHISTHLIPPFEELRKLGEKNGTCSTGFPKPIALNHGDLAAIYHLRSLPSPPGRLSIPDVFLTSEELVGMSPFFHAMGMIVLLRGIFSKGSLTVLPPEKPPNAQLVVEVLQQRNAVLGIFPPSILEQICSSEEGLRALGKLKYVFYGGGPLARGKGGIINKWTRVQTVIGSTEAGLIPTLVAENRNDWDYFEWAKGSGAVMEDNGDGLYELVLKPEDVKYQGVFHTFPDAEEWRTKDLLQPHPEKPGLWLYKGRKDDVLVLSNGEKFNPVGRFQTGLIVEPEWRALAPDHTPEALLDTLWPKIEELNNASPAHGKVWRSKVMFTKRDKPFKRAEKGSIMRRMTVALFEPEIEALYSDEASEKQLGKLDLSAGLPAARTFVRKALKLAGVGLPEDGGDDEDIFAYGVDSLQVLAISSKLSHALSTKDKRVTVSARTVYANPTINSLAAAMIGEESGEQANGTAAISREERMAKMVEKYTHDLPSSSVLAAPSPSPKKHTVVLTGSTGSLGNYTLQDLIDSPRVAKIYCLNRSGNAKDRQRESFQRRGIAADFTQVSFLHTDFGKDKFGLHDRVYDELLQTVDVFIHNAWAVDFNLALESYEGVHISGTRRCVDFSTQSKHRAHIIFISSIASVGNWTGVHPKEHEVPERLDTDHAVALPQGYGESKHVASLILAAGAQRSGVPCTVARAGQLAGPSNGDSEWNRHEWVPSIVISSKAMGAVPQDLGNQNLVDWVPMDLAGKTVRDLALSHPGSSATNDDLVRVAHIVNPNTTSWPDLVPAVRESLQEQSKRAIRTVSFSAWLDELKKTEPSPKEIEQKPALKLADFYEGLLGHQGMPRLATEETSKISQTVAQMQPVNDEMMRKWTQQW
ncbi:acetyl-CoA synthetase-like protein [Hortaea werneckii]|nr:acetyl-CoA synthetase-like protein [Hortaea werneckii]KAI7402989.1 acetyl-CoA synthetase-like protein [Hortaea werneckii]